MSYEVGIDIGGTFTDFVVMNGGGLVLDKQLSTPEDPSRAVIDGLTRVAERLGHSSLEEFLSETGRVVHGTTIADNTLIQMNGATTGLLTTDGFRDELALRRGFKEDIWDVRLPAPPEVVPRRRRLTVPERIAADGSVVTPLDEEAARAQIRRLAAQDVESVAIITIFSFVNPAHEQRLAELVAEELPGVPISLSHEIMPKAPEFERTSTTVLNAYVAPRVTGYLDRLSERLGEAGLLVMQSTGGVMTRAYMRQRPINVLASGPAGGVIGCTATGAAKDAADLLCVDMGGTSYDMSVVRSGEAPSEPGWNWHHRYLNGLPMIDVTTLGAGGGSIAHVVGGVVEVGPQSAGADPGPVCYGRGGELPTVTDANLVLGLLSADAEFAGGSMSLSTDGVNEAFERHVAGPMGYGIEDAAFDVWRMVNANMTQAIRRVTAEKGVDPSSLTMLAYGGNGPVHACVQAQDLGIDKVLVPRTSPAFSALGLLAADPMIDEERSYLTSSADAELDRIVELWRELAERAREHFRAGRFAESEMQYQFRLNFRYPGQNWSLTVPVEETVGEPRPQGFDEAALHRAINAFHDIHEAEHTYARRDQAPELTGVRVVTRTTVVHPTFTAGWSDEARRPEPARRRRVNLGQGYADTDVFVGDQMQPGDAIDGPAVIEESFTTIVVYPGWEAKIDRGGDYVLTRTG